MMMKANISKACWIIAATALSAGLLLPSVSLFLAIYLAGLMCFIALVLRPSPRPKGCMIAMLSALALPVFLIIVIGVYFSWPEPREDPVVQGTRILRTQLPPNTTELFRNDRGHSLPFPGGVSDGEFSMVLLVPTNALAGFIDVVEESDMWHELPITPEFAGLAGFNLSRFESDTAAPLTIDNVKGYFLFIDHQLEWNQKYPQRRGYNTEQPFWERPSLDYTLGVFDTETGKIYIRCLNT